jgi:hypothetical protein
LERATERRYFLCSPCRFVISRTVSQLKVNSWSDELDVRQSPVGKNVSTEAENIVRINHQGTTDADTAGRKDLVCPTVIYGM